MPEINIGPLEDRAGEKPHSRSVRALTYTLLLFVLAITISEARAQNSAGAGIVAFGSISGRVTAADPQQGIAGVNVLIRRVHAGVADFYFSRITAADGTFAIKYLLPGRYMVEIDTRTVPDAIFPPAAKLMIIDVAPDRNAQAEISIVRDTRVPQSARITDKDSKKPTEH